MEFVLDAYCGLYCGACPILLSTRAGMAAEPCHGCKSEQRTAYCASCGIRACAQGRGDEFCNECLEYASCALMNTFLKDANWPYQQAAACNLESIRQIGLSEWLKAQERRWRCDSCGAAHSWWDETCLQCGQAIASYKADL
jgi:hypothetical protein